MMSASTPPSARKTNAVFVVDAHQEALQARAGFPEAQQARLMFHAVDTHDGRAIVGLSQLSDST
jgi:hypothetical protein